MHLARYAGGMDGGGIYCLLLKLREDIELPVGALGLCSFPRGYYVYTGSALRGLGARIGRHLRPDKKHHWHVDYLLRAARVTEVFVLETGERRECELNLLVMGLPGARVAVDSFGSSDCGCRSHLFHFSLNPEVALEALVL
ncbi:MAG: GIY-YIG nuclease family protein [Euryarchaeota archaeon]|nr:GIY-YIG nuclease family protein [Euryarchaeota archaeon]